jgi:predicted glycosyltransferase
MIGLNSLKQIKNFPSVKLIHPDTPIKTILKYSSGIVTLNATTGVEALVLGRPVIALAKVNSYTEFHPNASLCTDLYDLPRLIIKMINEKVNDNDTDNYMLKMFKLSSIIRFESDRFISEDDADKKAMKFSKYIDVIINKYFQGR